MVTGGFRTAAGMADAISNDGVDMIGLGRPLCLAPSAPAALLRGEPVNLDQPERKLRLGPGLVGPQSPIKLLRAVNGLGSMTWYNEQLIRLGAGLEPDPELNFLPAFISMQKRDKRMARALHYDSGPKGARKDDARAIPAAGSA